MRRRFLVPEVIQTSATDCGPAALKALFAGHGIYLSYGRLREACQTDVDGTSIDTLEELGNALGLEIEQRMIAKELLLLDSSAALPAIVAVRLPGGAIHFVVVWRAYGPYVQVMDPAAGRLWITRRQLLESVYLHEHSVSASDWRAWTHSEPFQTGLRCRARQLRVPLTRWDDAGHLDASLRLAAALHDLGLLRRGAEAAALLECCRSNPNDIPDEYWSVRPDADGPSRVRVRGAVLLAATGSASHRVNPLPASLEAVRREAPPAVWAPVWQTIRESGILAPLTIAVALAAAAAGVAVEALLFRGALDLAQRFPLWGDRLLAIGLIVAFSATLLALEWAATAALFRQGRQLESRFRMLFMRKVPRLRDRYFQSRLMSDMASRVHALHLVRDLPEIAGRAASLVLTLIATLAGVAWLYPRAALPAGAASLAAIGIPFLFRRAMLERDLRVREASAGLSRFYLDALLGTRAIQAHSAEATLMNAQAPQLEQWTVAGLRRQTLMVAAAGVHSAATISCVVWMVSQYAAAGWSSVLLIFWAVSIPAIGAELGAMVWSLPMLRNTILRFLEPVSSVERNCDGAVGHRARGGVAIDIEGARVIAAGHRILDRVTLHITAGEHVAIVGASGSGKSSLVGLLLGWHELSGGTIAVDGRPLDDGELTRLHDVTAWIDPQVHLFRATVFDNVRFGSRSAAESSNGDAIDGADLVATLRRLPKGLQTLVGDRGAAVSSGEGQRIRIARGLSHQTTRLAILDEPARGLDRADRRRLLDEMRRRFASATVLAITHDVADTMTFDRVVVMEDGRIVESGIPSQLAAECHSRYATLLRDEDAVRHRLWRHPRWRRLRMTGGAIEEQAEQRVWTTV